MTLVATVLVVFAVESTQVDFDTQVVPILTKAGCNAASCHGSAAGRGGFKLSLFGGNPAWDYDEIVHRLEGRRINLATPTSSLIMTKPTEQIAHEGGTRFDVDGPEYTTLSDWVASGARRTQSLRLTNLEITPQSPLIALNETVQLHVIAHFDDGSQQEVTNVAVFLPSDAAALDVTESGKVTVLRRGRHHVIVRFLNDVQSVIFTTPLVESNADVGELPATNWIDSEINATLQRLHLAPASPADDATMLRRANLHLTGRLPNPIRVRSYLANKDPDKFTALIDELIDSKEFTEYWTYQLTKLLRLNPQPNNLPATKAFYGWVKQQLEKDTGWDEIASSLLLAEGDTFENGPANFYIVTGDARAQAEYVSELFMGVRLSCANCHNHPLDRWTQDDYHGLAAIFARIERGRTVRWLSRGEVIHPATGTPAVAKIPGDRFVPDDNNGRSELSRWLTSESNPYFSRAIVNRIWKALMGRGLVEPVDDIRATNPSTHPELLNRLATDFSANRYSFRHTIRMIMTSTAYARSGRTNMANEGDLQFYSHAFPTALEAEVLADAIADVTGIAEPFGTQPLGTRAINLVTPPESEMLEILGRCERSESCETSTSSSVGLSTKLHLLNGPLLNRRLQAESGRLDRLVELAATTEQIVDEFYLAALSRPATEEERNFWRENLKSTTSVLNRPAIEDFVWGLLNSREFVTNH
ncbi:MAG: DUF1553 domain-containing protein [Planctomycetales bacterium]|nr:DUF1553 domain-containing protein [Planctomycetales bacterium]